MNITLNPASFEEKPILERLMQLYEYDFTEFNDEDMNENGLYPYKYLPLYWTEPDRYPFLIRVDDQIAGFALVRLDATSLVDPPKKVNFIAEFFVLRKYRKHGVGEFAAWWVFDKFPGDWEVDQIDKNQPAQKFWQKIISRYSDGHFREVHKNDDDHHGPIQIFASYPKIP